MICVPASIQLSGRVALDFEIGEFFLGGEKSAKIRYAFIVLTILVLISHFKATVYIDGLRIASPFLIISHKTVVKDITETEIVLLLEDIHDLFA